MRKPVPSRQYLDTALNYEDWIYYKKLIKGFKDTPFISAKEYLAMLGMIALREEIEDDETVEEIVKKRNHYQ